MSRSGGDTRSERLSSSKNRSGKSARMGKIIRETFHREFSRLYNSNKRRMVKTAIAVLSISVLCALYTELGKQPILANPFFIRYPNAPNLFYKGRVPYKHFFSIFLTLPAAGVVFGNELDNPRFALYLRSSTDDGGQGASRSHQREVLEATVENAEGTVVEIIDVVESGKTMDRESLKDLLTLTREDEIDVIGVMEIDRLTRAPIFEVMEYYSDLEEHNCLLFSCSTGFIDLGNFDDLERLVNRTFYARRNYLRIQDGTTGSYVARLKEGRYPFGGSPIGYETNDDHDIWVVDEEREFIYRAFKTYIRTENRAKTLRRLNEKRTNQGKEKITDSRLKTLLESRLCIGQFYYEGAVWHTNPNIRTISDEMFQRVQEILKKRRQTNEPMDFPEFIPRAANRYGIEFVASILDTLKSCRKCGESSLRKNGTASVMDYKLQSYECSNPDCRYQGPLLKEKEIRELHQTNPGRCHLCPATDQFETKKIEVNSHIEDLDRNNLYHITCKICGNWFLSPMPPDKFKRAFELPEYKFDIESPISPTLSLREAESGSVVDDSESNSPQVTLHEYENKSHN